MAPRRSTARSSSVTPIQVPPTPKRAHRGGSALPAEDAIPRRTTRGASQQPSLADANVNNPRLPEVQIQQSYAYGSSKTPVLPTQLVARNKMNLREMADTIDAGVEQAQQHLQHHIDETHANLQKDARDDRARRRASRSNSREGSEASDGVEQDKTQRVAAWASSLENSQLDEVPEEEEDKEDDGSAESMPDDDTHKDTDPSSFPSGMFDHSYNYERNLRKPNVIIRRPEDSIFRTAWTTMKAFSQRSRQASSRYLISIFDWFLRLFQAGCRAIRDIPNSPIIFIVTNVIVALLLACAVGLLFCYAYSNYVCDPYSSSVMGLTLQKFCGTCTRSPSPSLNLTAGEGADLSKLFAAINNMNTQIRAVEAQISDKLESQSAAVDKSLDALRKQHSELSNHLAGLQPGRSTMAGDVASPVMAKVNYFAPNNGALIEPRLTSPTMQKPDPRWRRVVLRLILSAVYRSRPPETALSPWQDVGDCWCASANPKQDDSMRLGVRVIEMIYPTELVVENYPNAGSLFPGATPKTIQVWADFEHLDSREWQSLNIRQMQGDSPVGPTYALIGQVEYDASVEASHVQHFRLEVNQHQLVYAAQSFVIRVVSNHGSDYTCLYRVRMHGIPAVGVGKGDVEE